MLVLAVQWTESAVSIYIYIPFLLDLSPTPHPRFHPSRSPLSTKLSSLQDPSDVLHKAVTPVSFSLSNRWPQTSSSYSLMVLQVSTCQITWVRVSQGWNQGAGQAGLLPRGSGKTPASEFIHAMGRAQVLAVRGPAFLGCGWQALLSAPGGWFKAGPFQVPISILKPASGYLLVLRPFHALNLVSSATS